MNILNHKKYFDFSKVFQKIFYFTDFQVIMFLN